MIVEVTDKLAYIRVLVMESWLFAMDLLWLSYLDVLCVSSFGFLLIDRIETHSTSSRVGDV